MAREGPVQVYGGAPRPSRTGAAIDAVTMAFQAFIANSQRKKEEEEAVKRLVPYISSLGPKERGPLMAKLSAENPRVFSRVAEQVGTAIDPVDPLEQAQKQGMMDLIGYNPNPSISMERASPPPPATGPMGMFGPPAVGNPLGMAGPSAPYDPNRAKAPMPPGYLPLPKDPIERAHMLSARDTFILGKEAATGSWLEMNRGRVLSPEEQARALRVDMKLDPEANTLATETGQSARSAAIVAEQRHGHDVSAENSKRAAAVDRERIASTEADVIGVRQERLAELKSLDNRIRRNKEQIRDAKLDARTKGLTANDIVDVISEINRDTMQAELRMKELRSQPARPTEKTLKADRPNQYSAEQEAQIQKYMRLSGHPRETVIAAMKAEGEL